MGIQAIHHRVWDSAHNKNHSSTDKQARENQIEIIEKLIKESQDANQKRCSRMIQQINKLENSTNLIQKDLSYLYSSLSQTFEDRVVFVNKK